jgi:hypothetical protein
VRPTAGIRRVAAVVAAVSAVGLALLAVVPTLAASPTPAAGGDPRSSGQGPGLVGDPALAVLVVALIAVGTVVATLAYIRLTGGRRA